MNEQTSTRIARRTGFRRANEPAVTYSPATSRQVRFLVLVAALLGAAACSSDGSDASGLATTTVPSTVQTESAPGASTTAPSTTAPSTTAASSSVQPSDSDSANPDDGQERSPVLVMLSATGLKPLGGDGSYTLVSYSGGDWRDGGSFDIDGSSGVVVLDSATTGLKVFPEFANVAVVVAADAGDDQLAEKYFVADGRTEGPSTIELVDVSGRGLVQITLTKLS